MLYQSVDVFMATIHCSEKLSSIGSWTILHLPKKESSKLSSRGMAMAKGTLNGVEFTIPLEPDGKGSHWFWVTDAMQKKIGAKSGDSVKIAMEPVKEWPEPTVPPDIKKALQVDAKAHEVWKDTTTMARWDWIRWIRATSNPNTRKKRIVVACSKMRSGERRPCCFNRSMCTEPDVSKGGILL